MTTAQTIADIARRELHVGTLTVRNSDRLDFHNLSVATIKRALEAAYAAGAASNTK